MRPFGCKAYRNVTASITPEGELSGLSCDCPYDRGYCKHLAAAFIYLESIFDYIMPDYLFSYRYFRQHYESPVVKDGNEQAKQSLQRIVKPFILRRVKSGVLTELPRKNGNGADFGNGKGAGRNLFRERCGGALRGDGFKW